MIVSAGLTPAWQQLLLFDSLRWGEVNRAREALWCAAGKVLNAAIAAGRFGAPVRAVAPLGGMPVEAIDREFEAEGVGRRWVIARAATRVCTTVIDQGTGTITELVENGRPLAADEVEAFRAAFTEEAAKAAAAILIGSLPAGVPPSFYRELVSGAQCPTILDYRGEGLLASLELRPLVVKPNREELGQTLGRPLETDGDLLDAMRELNRRGARWAVVSQGSGPVRVTSRERAWRVYPLPADEIVSPIGCGDALAAGIAFGMVEGRDMLESVRLGVAAAATSLRQPRPGRLDAAAARRLAAEVRIEEG